MVFPVVMYGYEGWTIKKAKHWRIDVFELWCWRRLLRVPWTARRCNQSILKISPEYSLEGLMLNISSNTLATWCKELTHLKRPWCWERLKAGGEGDNKGWAGWMASPTQWTWVWVGSGSWWWTGRPGMLQSMGLQRVGHDWANELNWTEKRQKTQRSNYKHPLDHQKSKRVPEKHLLLLHWLHQSFDCVDHNKLWKILKEMGIPDHLTCHLRNLYSGKEVAVRTVHGTTDWFQIKRSTSRLYIVTMLT